VENSLSFWRSYPLAEHNNVDGNSIYFPLEDECMQCPSWNQPRPTVLIRTHQIPLLENRRKGRRVSSSASAKDINNELLRHTCGMF